MPLLEIRGLIKSYRKKTVLAGVDLTVYPGETVVLMGPSGCGKSTLVRCINRLTEPDAGTIFFDGCLVNSLSGPGLAGVRRKMGYVFQQFNLIQRLSVIDNVVLALRMHGLPWEEAEGRGMDALSGGYGGESRRLPP